MKCPSCGFNFEPSDAPYKNACTCGGFRRSSICPTHGRQLPIPQVFHETPDPREVVFRKEPDMIQGEPGVERPGCVYGDPTIKRPDTFYAGKKHPPVTASDHHAAKEISMKDLKLSIRILQGVIDREGG